MTSTWFLIFRDTACPSPACRFQNLESVRWLGKLDTNVLLVLGTTTALRARRVDPLDVNGGYVAVGFRIVISKCFWFGNKQKNHGQNQKPKKRHRHERKALRCWLFVVGCLLFVAGEASIPLLASTVTDVAKQCKQQ